jgi:hypothetical protein
MHVVILCCFKLCIWFYIRSRALQNLCCVFDFMPNQNGFFLSYLMLVPVLSSDVYTVLLFCLHFLAILVCNFACDLCCFIVNVYSVKSSVELMLYCFIMCRIKIQFFLSYVILLHTRIRYKFDVNRIFPRKIAIQ